jgi:hypothetical protein
MSQRIVGKTEFWPRYNENPDTVRVQSIGHLRSLLSRVRCVFIPGMGEPVSVARVPIELEDMTFLIELVGGKSVTIPYQIFEDYAVYRTVDDVLELMRLTDWPPPWGIDRRIDSGGLEWTVDGKHWPYRAKQEDFMEREYGYMEDGGSTQEATYFASLSNTELRRPGV